jgi:hypothetical protein
MPVFLGAIVLLVADPASTRPRPGLGGGMYAMLKTGI